MEESTSDLQGNSGGDKMIKTFQVSFIKVNPEEFDLKCSFCEKEKSSWW